MRPNDRTPPLPEQAACIRLEVCCLYLREVLPPKLYTEVRTAVSRWNIESEERDTNVRRIA